MGGAVGSGNPKLAGIYLQVSCAVLFFVGFFVFLSWNFTEFVWVMFGSDPEISKMAGYYARVLAFSIPAQILFSQISQFFSAQRIMHPEVNASTMSMILNLAIGLVFVLGVGIPKFSGYGFAACPIVTTAVVWFQVLTIWYVYIYRQRLHEDSWDGWSMKEITWARIKTFSNLYFPGALGKS